eukprot:5732978-Pyramimonas_sp.AAC.1
MLVGRLPRKKHAHWSLGEVTALAAPKASGQPAFSNSLYGALKPPQIIQGVLAASKKIASAVNFPALSPLAEVRVGS